MHGLRHLILLPPSVLSLQVAGVALGLRKMTPQDQGSMDVVNAAVVAVAAALIHHNGLAAEFNALCQGSRALDSVRTAFHHLICDHHHGLL